MEAIKELKDLSAFHTSVSVALRTALQHLVDSLFVQLPNFVLLRQDSNLEFVKPVLKPDIWNKLRNTLLFSYGLFQMTFWPSLNRISSNMRMHQVLMVLVQACTSTLEKWLSIDTNLMTRKTVDSQECLISDNLGGSSQVEAKVAVVGMVAPTPLT